MTPGSLSALSAECAKDYLDFAGGLADAAAAVTLPLFRQPLPVETKADASPFTKADCEAERAMTEKIRAHHPAHGLVGEEFGATRQEAEFVWVLDPIDGTRSFISGSRQYGTLICLLHNGTPVVSVLDFPALGERWEGVCTAAHAEAKFNGAPCRVAAQAPPLAHAVAATTTIAVQPQAPQDTQLHKLLAACGQVRLGGDAYAYAGLAAGFAHLAADYLMQPYDYLPLMPVMHAAGGVMSDWQGKPLAPFRVGAESTVVAAASEALHQEALSALAALNA